MNNFNPYNNFYGNSGGYYYQPQPQIQQSNYIPVIFVNGIEGAKAFNVPPGKMFYLKDSDSQKLYIKEADNTGRQYMQSFVLTKEDEVQPSVEFITKSDFKELHDDLLNKIDILSSELKTALKGDVNNE